MLVGIACVPLLVRFLGPERVGILSMIWVVISYCSVLDVGVTAAITRAASITLASDDPASIPQVFWSAAALQTLMGTAGMIGLMIAAPAVAHALHVPAGIRAECVTTIRICALGLPVVLVSGSVTGLLQAASEFKILAKYQVPFSIAQYVFPVLAARSGRGLPAIVALMVAIRLASLLITFNVARRLFSLLSGAVRVSPRLVRDLLSFGLWVTVSSVVSPVLVYIDRFLIANRLGLSSVAYYSIPLDAVMRLLLFSSSVTAVLYPAFSGMSGSGQVGRASSVAGASLRYVLCCTGTPAVVLLLFAPDILQKWIGPDFAVHSASVLRILLAGIVANALARVPYSLLQSHGLPKVTAILQLAALPLQVLATLSLMAWLGLTGAALAWSARLVLETILLFYFAHRSCEFSLRQAWAGSRAAVYTLILVLSLGELVTAATAPNAILRLFAAAAVAAFGSALLWFLALSSQDRSLVRSCLYGRG